MPSLRACCQTWSEAPFLRTSGSDVRLGVTWSEAFFLTSGSDVRLGVFLAPRGVDTMPPMLESRGYAGGDRPRSGLPSMATRCAYEGDCTCHVIVPYCTMYFHAFTVPVVPPCPRARDADRRGGLPAFPQTSRSRPRLACVSRLRTGNVTAAIAPRRGRPDHLRHAQRGPRRAQPQRRRHRCAC